MSTTTHRFPHWRSAFGVAALLLAACTDRPGPLDLAGPSAAPGEFGRPRSVPVRGRIVFTATFAGGGDVYSIYEDGSGLVRLTYTGGNFDPAVSPDGKKIAFVRVTSDGTTQASDIYVMNADGSGLKRVTSFNAPSAIAINEPAWSPDGRKLAFTRHIPGTGSNYELYVVNASGSNLVQLTDQPGFDGEPTWSPDGSKIAFTSWKGDESGASGAGIYVINPDGTGIAPLFACASFTCKMPDWSPDGASIAYTNLGGIRRYILATNADVPVIANAQAPAWSPDGVKIAYVTTTASPAGEQLGVVNVNTSDPKLITAPESYVGDRVDWARAP